MKKFQNKYRIPSARAVWWNYSNEGSYFVTICSHNRQWFFGSITDQKMELSEIGKLAHQFWFGIPNHFPFVKLHAFVVMPNHVHGIIEISNIAEETLHATSVLDGSDSKNKKIAAISPKKGSLASILRSYKSAVTKEARKIDPDFEWQERFHDHIIRDEPEYHRIENYINNNPRKWDDDKFNE
ncbi:transposase [Labilibaculum antarcticum]|uniref:Transposase n=1 Tax=Labilibaculum antarcticum TaxID=1717717 RepID=A0A1Y1CIL8_9BACT|nr:transposase [Labilibaculum antarcticum]BAX80174.1 transposase [Labilibaculum antarcticum]